MAGQKRSLEAPGVEFLGSQGQMHDYFEVVHRIRPRRLDPGIQHSFGVRNTP